MKTFFVLDFDRCLGDTDAIQHLLEKVITEEIGVSIESFQASRAKMEGDGKTFTTIEHVHQLLRQVGSNKTWNEVRGLLIEASRNEDLMLPYAGDFLVKLNEEGVAYGIVTYGVEEAWQLTKLELAGLINVPHLVTHIETKSMLLEGWRQPSGQFVIPPALSRDFSPIVTEEIVLIDDKARSFWGMPKGVRGVHVIAPNGNKLPSQQGEVPANVTDVIGMKGALQLLFR